MPNNTLEKWEEKQLKDICDFHNGLWTGKKEPFIECNVIRNANFTKDFKLNYDNVVKINVEERQFQTRELEYGDLILEKSGGGPNQPVGRVVIFDKHEKGYSFSNFTSSIRIKNKDILDFRFLYLYLCHCYLSGMTTKMQKNSTGIRNLLFDDYKNIYVPIPNINEQQQIVKILDEAFENIEKAKQNALQNLNNAKELFENCIEDNFTKLAKSYPVKTLSDIAVIKGGKRLPKGQKLTKEITLHPYLRVTDFTIDGTINTDDLHYISDNIYEQIKNYTITSKDLYITIVGTIGKSGIIPKELDGANLTENACKLIFNNDVCNKYVYYFTKTKSFNEQSFGNTKITAVPKLALTRLATIKLPISSVPEQQKIVQQLDELQEQTKKLEQIYEQKIKDLDELKQSILQKAFNGEL